MKQIYVLEKSPTNRAKMKMTFRRLLELIFLRLPFEEKPGVLAMILTVLRMTIFGFAGTALLVLMGFRFDAVGRSLSWFCFVFFEELGRYAFLRKAENTLRAAIFFCLAIVLIETASYFRPGVDLLAYARLRAPSVAVHVLSTALMAWAVRHPKFKLPTFAAIVLVHAAFDVWASNLTA